MEAHDHAVLTINFDHHRDGQARGQASVHRATRPGPLVLEDRRGAPGLEVDLTNWARELDGEISRLRVVELEALYEQYHLLKEGRIRLLGDALERLREQLATRDLSDISTDKLFDLLLRYRAALIEEHVDLEPLSEEDAQLLNESPASPFCPGDGS